MMYSKDQYIQALTIKAPTLICGSGHRIERCCFDIDCKQDSLCCSEQSCNNCENLHRKCSFIMLRELNQAVEDRQFIQRKTLRAICQIQNQLIDRLISNRRLIFDEIQKVELKNQSKIIQEIYFKNNFKGFKGRDIRQLFLDISKTIETNTDGLIQSQKKKSLQIFSQMENMRINLFETLRKEKSKKEFEQGKKTIQSKILESDKQGKEKHQFLMKSLNYPSQLKLLFRASEHNFSASKFHQYCDGISNTITIARTQFGKTIAAFTPLKWSSTPQCLDDDSLTSFLLQLDLKQKMSLISPNNAIYNYPNRGPTFGGGHDLCIANQCNTKRKSISYFPISYNCMGKYELNEQSWSAFCGNPDSQGFRVLEYEVFVVIK